MADQRSSYRANVSRARDSLLSNAGGRSVSVKGGRASGDDNDDDAENDDDDEEEEEEEDRGVE